MPGNKQSGIKAKAKNLAKDPDYYKKLGSIGGSAPHKVPRGFANGEEGRKRASIYGTIGGRRSRRVYTDEQRQAISERNIARRKA